MSPTSYQTAPPRDDNINIFSPATSYSRKGKAFTTIGAEKLNFRVRDGNGCDLLAIITGLFLNNIMYIICCLLFRMGIFILSKLNNVRLFTE